MWTCVKLSSFPFTCSAYNCDVRYNDKMARESVARCYMARHPFICFQIHSRCIASTIRWYVMVLEREKSMFLWIKGKIGLRRDKAGGPSMEFVYDEGKVGHHHKCTKRPSSAEHPYSCTYCWYVIKGSHIRAIDNKEKCKRILVSNPHFF